MRDLEDIPLNEVLERLYGAEINAGIASFWDNGTGEASSDRRKSTLYKGVPFALKYIRLIATLPGLELAGHATDSRLRFRFDGGIGSVMGLIKPTNDVVDVFHDGQCLANNNREEAP